jgi:hypothetical protein
VPLLEDVASASLAHELRGLVPLERPVSGNVSGYGDGELTAGLVQYPDDGHFAVFDNSEAAYTYLGFLLSAVEAETPTIQSRDWRPGVEAP